MRNEIDELLHNVVLTDNCPFLLEYSSANCPLLTYLRYKK
jgi:hypothetical protein